MRFNRPFLYRSWRYFRDGYALYISKPITIFNFLTITFYLLVERVSWLQMLFPHFYIYSVVALVTFVPLSILFGWLHMRKTGVFAVESILATESNPQTVHIQRVSMEQTFEVLKALNVKPTKEFMAMYMYWKRLDKKIGWKP